MAREAFMSGLLQSLLMLASFFLAAASTATGNARFIEHCASTDLRIITKHRFMSQDVFRSKRLAAGEGTRDCAGLCKGDENCWTFNYDKNRKMCYLSSSEADEVQKQRKGSWSCGYRSCVFNSTAETWSNAQINFGSLTCAAGAVPNEQRDGCECEVGYYSATPSTSPCTACTAQSTCKTSGTTCSGTGSSSPDALVCTDCDETLGSGYMLGAYGLCIPGNGKWFGMASDSTGTTLATVNFNGLIFISTDGGLSWDEKESARYWNAIALSSDGTKAVAVAENNEYIYTSTSPFSTWTARDSPREWYSVASSSDGTKLVACVAYGGYIYTSTNSGETWTQRGSYNNWQALASDSTGTKLVAGGYQDYLYVSTDAGANWTPKLSDAARDWHGICSSSDGTKVVAAAISGKVYTSTDSGTSWTPRDSDRNWYAVACDSTATNVVAVVQGGYIYTSTDSGVTWTQRATTRNWLSVASSSDGSKLIAGTFGNKIYKSVDSGVTWEPV